MKKQRRRLGIRAQLTIIVLIGTIMTTVATLFVASTTINEHDKQQAVTQQQENMQIALLELHTEYGTNISIASDGTLVADYPTTQNTSTTQSSDNYGKYPLDHDIDYVDGVKNLIHEDVSIYKCANPEGQPLPGGCVRIATTFAAPQSGVTLTDSTTSARDTGVPLGAHIYSALQQSASGTKTQQCAAATSTTANCGPDTIVTGAELGIQYQTDYYPLTNPQQQLVGALAISIPVTTIDELQKNTTIGLILIGVIMMIAGVILALLFASAVVNTLQAVARQVSDASERIGGIAAQQSGGAAQQVWAVNAINKALQNFTEMARDISQRTDQLALMGNQVIQRRGEIAPAQIDSILAYITRSVRDISVASRQQSTQYERMTSAMQAVIEIADQVANSSQQSTESSEQLDRTVGQLQQLVGIRRLTRRRSTGGPAVHLTNDGALDGIRQERPATPRAGGQQPSVRAMRPGTGAGMMGAPKEGIGGMRGAMPPMPGYGAQAPGYGAQAPGYGAQAPMSGALIPNRGMPNAPAHRGARPSSDADMGRMPPTGRAPLSGGVGGGNNRMPLPPLPDESGMPPATHGRMSQGMASGAYPRPPAADGAPRPRGDGRNWNEGGPPSTREPGRDPGRDW